MAVTKVCSTCLSFDVEMFSLTNDEIRECLQKVITDIKIELEDELLQNVCAECVLLMRKFVKFKNRCLEANRRLRQILSQSINISEALLKSESRKLYSETIIDFDDVPIISDTKVTLLQVKEEELSEESLVKDDSENLPDDYQSPLDSILISDISSVKNDAEISYSPLDIVPDQYDSHTQDEVMSVNYDDVESEYVEEKKTLQANEDCKNIRKLPQKKNLTGSIKKDTKSVKKKKALWKSDYAVQVNLTEEQQKEELLKKEISENYLNASFKCNHCVMGFISKEKFEQHMDSHDEISEALLKSESRKLYSETIIDFDDVPIISDTKVTLLQVKEEELSEESLVKDDSENLPDDYQSPLDSILISDISSVKNDAEISYSPLDIVPDQYDSHTQDEVMSVNYDDVESEYVEEKKTLQANEDCKNIRKLPQKKNLTGSIKKDTKSVKKKKALWKSDYAVQVNLTEEQQKEELLKKEISENYLNASFKCNHCVMGFISKEKFEQHMDSHDESRGALQCDICLLRFCNLPRLRLHQTSHRKRYKCLTCGTLTKTQKQAMRHHNRHVGIRFECKLCNAKFQEEQLYRRHTRTEHPTDYVCDLCGDYFTSRVHLNQHNNTSKDCRKSPKNILVCKMCDVTFLKVNRWYNHMLGHAKEKDQISPSECQICEHKTTCWTDWSRHIVYEHRYSKKDDTTRTSHKEPAKTFICDVCGSGLSSKAKLSIHIHTQHTEENAVSPYYKFKWQDKCEVCNKNILRTNMKRHLTTHTGEKPFKCDECGKCFSQAFTRDYHAQKVHKIIVKTGVQRRKRYPRKESNEQTTGPQKRSKKFQCTECPKKLHSKFSLEIHVRSHTGEKPFACDVCQRTYTNKYYLEIHKNIHTGEKSYACDLCDQKFYNKSYLQAHKNNHTGEKRYSCDICNMRFKQKSNLTRHGLVHTGAKNWTCDLCGKPFTQLNSLNLHIKTVHLHLPHPPRKPRKKKE